MYIFFFVFLGLLWAFSWLLFVGSALFAAALYLSVTAFRQIEYSIRGLCRYGITLWDLVQNSKSRWQLCALTGTGVAVTRILVWSAVAFAQRIHPDGAAEMVGLVVFPEVFTIVAIPFRCRSLQRVRSGKRSRFACTLVIAWYGAICSSRCGAIVAAFGKQTS